MFCLLIYSLTSAVALTAWREKPYINYRQIRRVRHPYQQDLPDYRRPAQAFIVHANKCVCWWWRRCLHCSKT